MVTYREAGVDIEKANNFVEFIKKRVKKGNSFFDTLGGFAGGFELRNLKTPVIVTSTDGVGTKLKVAQELGIHNTVGIDLVAMNVNDVLTSGIFPTLFLDYIASGRIKLEILKEIMEGILEGCKMAEVVLAGGETAEMPSFYPDNVYDLAGFCVGVGEKEELYRMENIKEGDILIGIRSNGIHSNGYSLVRKILNENKVHYDRFIEDLGAKVGEILLEPTLIYIPYIRKLKGKGLKIKASAHVTGGGIKGNLERIVPNHLKAVVEKRNIPPQPVFYWLKDLGKVREEEMYKTFNMGVGYILIVEEMERDKILKVLGDKGFFLGYIERGSGEILLV